MANQYSHLDSFSLTIDATNAVLRHPKFASLSGISKVSQGKRFQDWAKIDQQKYQAKLRSTVGHHFFVGMTYLSSENMFFVRPQKVNPYLSNLGHKARIYQQTVAGEDYGEKVELRFYIRSIESLGWCITVAIWYDNDKFGDDKRENLRILCDFPLVATQGGNQHDELLQQYGFKVERYDNIDGFTDEFGDYEYGNSSTTVSKNDVRVYI